MIRALFLPGSFLALCLFLSAWHWVFWLGVIPFTADVIGRWRDYQHLRQLSYSHRHKLLHIYATTACGRQCMIGAHGEGASWYYYRQGYRLHHIFPDGAFTKNSPFLRVIFWRGLANGHLDRRTK